MFRNRNWFGGGWGRPKNPHSLEQLKYLYNVLIKNGTVSESNRGLLVETLRCIAEILIWGDQNDSSVFDFFLEKNMLSYFLKIMVQKSGGSSFVCVQLLQTLNILFENIRNETSLYYLLSNNHVNSIIVHKFDFSDEEVMAYYISFLKTLSLKLNSHTIHFFYNEHTKDFPLYTEAIKFFNHPESMVRIAVRTLTLNVYRVQDASMLRFIRDRTAAPYFSNLVWFIGKHILELDMCVKNAADFQAQQKLDGNVAEHLDHLHYINDILCLNIPDLNDVLTEHLLHKLFIPLYIYSLTKKKVDRTYATPTKDQVQNIETITKKLSAVLRYKASELVEDENKPSVSIVVALFLLSQVFLILTHGPIVHALAWILLQSDTRVFEEGATKILEMYVKNRKSCVKLEFSKPSLSLEKALDPNVETSYIAGPSGIKYTFEHDMLSCDLDPELVSNSLPSTSYASEVSSIAGSCDELAAKPLDVNTNITDEEKQKLLCSGVEELNPFEKQLKVEYKDVEKRTFLKTILVSLDCSENDYEALLALCLLYALVNNKGINIEILNQILAPAPLITKQEQTEPNQEQCTNINCSNSITETTECSSNSCYNTILIDKLLSIITQSCSTDCKVRLVTLELTAMLTKLAAGNTPHAKVRAAADAARIRSSSLLRLHLDTDDVFLDMFEDEYNEMCKGSLNIERLCMDSSILLPPKRTPMSGIPYNKRLPSGQVERTRQAIRTFLIIRQLYLELSGLPETQLPLTNIAPFNKVGDLLDLNDSDLISCRVSTKDSSWQHRFLTVDGMQVTLVEPDKQKAGWGVAKLVASLQHLDIQGNKDDSCCLNVSLNKAGSRELLMQATLKFDDNIRCYSAKQRLSKGRTVARQRKMLQITKLLEAWSECSTPSNVTTAIRSKPQLRQRHPGHAHRDLHGEESGRLRRPSAHMNKDGVVIYKDRIHSRTRGDRSLSRSRDSSPRAKQEDIPMDLIPQPPPAVKEVASNSSHLPRQQSSEETSFMSPERSKSKRKGTVETV